MCIEILYTHAIDRSCVCGARDSARGRGGDVARRKSFRDGVRDCACALLLPPAFSLHVLSSQHASSRPAFKQPAAASQVLQLAIGLLGASPGVTDLVSEALHLVIVETHEGLEVHEKPREWAEAGAKESRMHLVQTFSRVRACGGCYRAICSSS